MSIPFYFGILFFGKSVVGRWKYQKTEYARALELKWFGILIWTKRGRTE